jgi:hypothetical protein
MPDETAVSAGVRREAVQHDAVSTGCLPRIGVGLHIRFTHSMLEDWLAER